MTHGGINSFGNSLGDFFWKFMKSGEAIIFLEILWGILLEILLEIYFEILLEILWGIYFEIHERLTRVSRTRFAQYIFSGSDRPR